MFKKTLFFTALSLCAFVTEAQDSFVMDFDSTIGLTASQYDYPGEAPNTFLQDTIYEDYSREQQIILDFILDTSILANHRIDSGFSMNYNISGFFGYARDTEFLGNLDLVFIQFVFGETAETQFDLTIGRQEFVDPTGYILDQALDGIHTYVRSGILEFNFGLGYAGLFPGNESNIILSPDDRANFRNVAWGTAAPRLILASDLSLNIIPELVLGLHLGLQIDLRENPNSYNLTSWYIGIHNSADIIPEILSYSTQLDMSASHFSDRNDPSFGVFFNTHWTLNFLTNDISVGGMRLGFDLASEDFRTISNLKQGYYFLGDLASLFAFSWRFDWQPFARAQEYWIQNLNLFLQAKHLFSTADTAISRGGISTVAGDSTFGQEFTLGLEMYPLSDVGIEAVLGGLLGDASGRGQFFSSIYVYFTL